MTDGNERKDAAGSQPGGQGRKPLTLTRTTGAGTVKQSFSHGRSKSVVVEMKQRRVMAPPSPAAPAQNAAPKPAPAPAPRPAPGASQPGASPAAAPGQAGAQARPNQTGAAPAAPAPAATAQPGAAAQAATAQAGAAPVRTAPTNAAQASASPASAGGQAGAGASAGQGAARQSPAASQSGANASRQQPTAARAAPPLIRPAGLSNDEFRRRQEAVARAAADDEARRDRSRQDEEQRRALEEAQRRMMEEDQAASIAAEEVRRKSEAEDAARAGLAQGGSQAGAQAGSDAAGARAGQTARAGAAGEDAAPASGEDILSELGGRVKTTRRALPIAPAVKPAKKGEQERRKGKLTLDMVERITEGDDERVRSLAAMRRAREKERQRRTSPGEQQRVLREVTIPESITIQELSNRMAIRAVDIVKYLMRQDTMATIDDVIDADTAELIATDFGHTVRRVAAADVEEGLAGDTDSVESLKPRPPVVTVMGHVDHGKTSLLDALRKSDVVAGEAGGITQHIGAYQVRLGDGGRVTFLDTPGHAAFSSMRSRGAQVTDIVVLVVAADDGVMPQTVEAINHAKAAGVPIIVAVNKIDKPEANPTRVVQELLQYEVVAEQFGGDVQVVQVSALKREGLDELVDTILLQAEVLDLKANPDRAGEATIVEARLDRGRGPVATALVRRGTLRRGDIIVAGSQWGKVRALTNERGQQAPTAGPSEPVEIMGLEGVPEPGDTLQVVDSETRAREVTSYRQSLRREKHASGAGARGSLEQMMAKFKDQTSRELPVVIKADVQGSAEAIANALEKLGTEEVRARVLQAAVGGINEADITLAKASSAPVIGFNVRASKEARDLAEREGVEIRYYAIIYDLIEDIKGVMSGMLAPITRETFLGNAEILEVFQITRIGRVAGCRVTEGKMVRGARVRLLRDNVVIHEGGKLNTLKRFKDDANEVQSGQECGMSFENYQDIKAGDLIECFNVEVVQRSL